MGLLPSALPEPEGEQFVLRHGHYVRKTQPRFEPSNYYFRQQSPPDLHTGTAVKNPVALIRDQLRVEEDADGALWLHGELNSTSACTVNVHFGVCLCTEDDPVVPQRSLDPVTFAPGQRQKLKPAQALTSVVPRRALGQVNENAPILIEIRSEDPPATEHTYLRVFFGEEEQAAQEENDSGDERDEKAKEAAADQREKERLPTPGSYPLRVIKQRVLIGYPGRQVGYDLQEIYGGDKDLNTSQDTAAECVICLCEQRDTAVLPCRHLCLCQGCADAMRTQSRKCPICRQAIESLLFIQPAK